MAYKVFENGFPLPASDLNNYLMNQSVMVFASSTDRASSLTAPVEGMLTWLQDSNKFSYYSGSAWVDLIPAETQYLSGVTSNIQTQLDAKAPATQAISNKSANYTIVAGDAGSLIVSTGSAITITIANVLSVGQRIDFLQDGTGQITFAAGSGVTLQSKASKLKTAAQESAATIVCVASGQYRLIGDLG